MCSMASMFILLSIDKDIAVMFKNLLEVCVEDLGSEMMQCLEFALKNSVWKGREQGMVKQDWLNIHHHCSSIPFTFVCV